VAQRLQDPGRVEATTCQVTHVTDIRRPRYLGLPKITLEHALAAAAINLIRYDAWLTGTQPDRTRTTPTTTLYPKPHELELTNRV
jgi:hypothetical protein